MATDCNPSLWTATAALPRFEPLRGDVRTDVLVIGGGIAGLLCARLLTDAGVDMLLVEADRIASGVTARTTAKITAQHGLLYDKLLRRFGPEPAALYLRANEQAVAAYRRMSEGIDCGFETKDNYVYSPAAPDWKPSCARWTSSGIPPRLSAACRCRSLWTARSAFGNRRSSGRWTSLQPLSAGCAFASRPRCASWRE